MLWIYRKISKISPGANFVQRPFLRGLHVYSEGNLRFKLDWASLIECFHSRGQHLCKFIGTKESVCIRKEFNSHRTGLGHQHGHRFIVLGHQFGRHDIM